MHTKFNRPDVSLHGPDDQASYMEIACTSSNRPDVSLQGPDAPSLIIVILCSGSVTVRTRPCFGSFQRYLGKAVAVDRPDAQSSRPDTFWYFGHNVLLKYRIGTKLASLESLKKML